MAETSPNMYLYELVNWLMTIVDSLQLDERYKDEAYKAALQHVATSLAVRVSFSIRSDSRYRRLLTRAQ